MVRGNGDVSVLWDLGDGGNMECGIGGRDDERRWLGERRVWIRDRRRNVLGVMVVDWVVEGREGGM